jgi:hypothetical protein
METDMNAPMPDKLPPIPEWFPKLLEIVRADYSALQAHVTIVPHKSTYVIAYVWVRTQLGAAGVARQVVSQQHGMLGNADFEDDELKAMAFDVLGKELASSSAVLSASLQAPTT